MPDIRVKTQRSLPASVINNVKVRQWLAQISNPLSNERVFWPSASRPVVCSARPPQARSLPVAAR